MHNHHVKTLIIEFLHERQTLASLKFTAQGHTDNL